MDSSPKAPPDLAWVYVSGAAFFSALVAAGLFIVFADRLGFISNAVYYILLMPIALASAAVVAPGRASPGQNLLGQWNRLSRLPGGKWLFARLLGRMVPYSGSIAPRVEQLEPGYARVRISDRRRVRNHLDSIHAVALLNLAELTSGLALTTALPVDARAILTGLSMEYLKKARGVLSSECRVRAPVTRDRLEHTLEAAIRDAAGEIVARAEARWLVSPLEETSAPIPPLVQSA